MPMDKDDPRFARFKALKQGYEKSVEEPSAASQLLSKLGNMLQPTQPAQQDQNQPVPQQQPDDLTIAQKINFQLTPEQQAELEAKKAALMRIQQQQKMVAPADY